MFWIGLVPVLQKKNEAEMQRGFTEKTHCCPCVCTLQPSSPRSYSTHTYISGNKEKQEKKQIIFLYISIVIVVPYIQQIDVFFINLKANNLKFVN